MVKLIYGDSLHVLASMPENSVDCVVTDPPYGLGAEPDPVEMLKAWITTGHFDVKGKGFMGKAWDAFVPQPALWKEVFRVLKPGGHLLSFFGTRTYDWGTLAIRLAGFEIRDQLAWVYGSGFPKSLDISKAIDKQAGAEREVIGKNPTYRKMQEVAANYNLQRNENITAPATEAAKQWQGWGTALKPAFEPICVARKPLEGSTVAENVFRFGTGGINIDGCRIEAPDGVPVFTKRGEASVNAYADGLHGSNRTGEIDSNTGRWPANLIHDGSEDVVSLFPNTKSGGLTAKQQVNGVFSGTKNCYGTAATGGTNEYGANEGSAARFFYCAKASKADRDEGLGDHSLKQAGIKNSSGRGFSETDPNKEILRANNHPTVKPTALMRWLVKLVCPPGGTVLDVFGGSGSTGKASALEGFDAILVEREKDYIGISHGRILPFAPVKLIADGYELDLESFNAFY